MTALAGFSHRRAAEADIPALRALMEAAIGELQRGFLTAEQIAASRIVMGLDTQLIADGTYFAVEAGAQLVGCGGWSRRRAVFGGDRERAGEDAALDPARDPARVRAFFVHPDWARRGIGSMILEACETAAKSEGFTRFEMGSTLTGVPLYRARGYAELERVEVSLPGGILFPIVHMAKNLREHE